MSNEYKDWLEDQKHEARWWIERYPFLQIKENGVCPWFEKDGYENTWLDDAMPDGWIVGFCEQMCNELMDALGDYADKWIILQMKEKFGELRIYHSGIELPEDVYSKVDTVITKYEDVSSHTCGICGKPATKYNSGWILPVCDEHYRG